MIPWRSEEIERWLEAARHARLAAAHPAEGRIPVEEILQWLKVRKRKEEREGG